VTTGRDFHGSRFATIYRIPFVVRAYGGLRPPVPLPPGKSFIAR
jgi:hypothetical protein